MAGLGAAVRVGTAVLLALLGGLFACGSAFAAWISSSPFAGGRESSPWSAAGYALLTLICLALPAAAWWFLLPRARWWGVPATVTAALLTAAAFSSGL